MNIEFVVTAHADVKDTQSDRLDGITPRLEDLVANFLVSHGFRDVTAHVQFEQVDEAGAPESK